MRSGFLASPAEIEDLVTSKVHSHIARTADAKLYQPPWTTTLFRDISCPVWKPTMACRPHFAPAWPLEPLEFAPQALCVIFPSIFHQPLSDTSTVPVILMRHLQVTTDSFLSFCPHLQSNPGPDWWVLQNACPLGFFLPGPFREDRSLLNC